MKMEKIQSSPEVRLSTILPPHLFQEQTISEERKYSENIPALPLYTEKLPGLSGVISRPCSEPDSYGELCISLSPQSSEERDQ